MTAQGVMNGMAGLADFPGFSFVNGTSKNMGSDTFDQAMEQAKGTKTTDLRTKTEIKAFAKKDGVGNPRKDIFTGSSGGKNIATAKTDGQLQEDVTETVATMLVQLRSVICEVLQMTDEELSDAMESLGLSDSDLIDNDRLRQLFLNVKDVNDPTALLTDEGLLGDFAEMVQAAEQTISETGLSKQQISETAEKILPAPSEALEETEAQPLAAKADAKQLQTESSTEQTDTDEGAEQVSGQPLQKENREIANNSQDSQKKDTNLLKAEKKGDTKTVDSAKTPELKGMFVENLMKAVEAGTQEAVEAADSLREIANQVLEQIKIVIRPEQTNMELQLNPEHLGRVHLTVTEKEGMMTASFTTQTQVAKEALESQMTTLRETLKNQGIQIEAIEVTVAEFGFATGSQAKSQTGEGKEQSTRRNRNGLSMGPASEEENTETNRVRFSDSNVDYSA